MTKNIITYAIGDVHGMTDQLVELMKKVEEHAAGVEGPKQAVFLGDYVDRGDDSAGAVRLIRNWSPGFDVIALRGNHEDMMLKWSKRNYRDIHWAGSYPETLRSYQLDSSGNSEELTSDLAWIETLPVMHRSGKYVFVHAGIRPKKELESQTEDDMLWIRHDFLMSQKDYGFVVVHGHTPYEDCPHVLHNRVNVDSGCFYTGVLSAVVLDGGPTPKILQAVGDPGLRYKR